MDAKLLQKENESLKLQIAELTKNNSTLQFSVEKLKEQVHHLQYLHFGSKSEKLTKEDKQTASLFNEAEDTAFAQQDENEKDKVTKTTEISSHTRKNKRNAGRKPLNESLPREIVEYDIPEDKKTCACGSSLKCIGEDISERLKIYPVKVTVLQEKRKKYVCECCEGRECIILCVN